MRLVLVPLLLVVASCGFNSARWAAARGINAGDNPRAAMVCDAVAAGLQPGARKDEIRALLGAPDSEGPTADVYEVGLEFTAPDLIVLGIQYDDAGAVVETVTLGHDWGFETLQRSVPGSCGDNWAFVRNDD